MITAPYTRRRAKRELGIGDATLDAAVKAGALRLIPWGRHLRIPAEDVARVAREGFTVVPRPRARARRHPGSTDPAALRNLDIETLRRKP